METHAQRLIGEKNMEQMEKRFLLAYEDAIATKGKRKGKLKTKPPAYGSDGYIVWQALVLEHNPIRASVMSCVMASMCDPELYDYALNRAPNIARCVVI
jgi:hypothetical protein